MANIQKKLARALKDAAGVRGTGMAPANAMQASAALFEAIGEVDGKLAKLAEKEYDSVSSEVRKHFKKMAKEEKAHDELTFNTNVKLKQASASYDKKVKGKVPYTADEHAKHVHLLSALGNEMAAAKLAHETLVSQRHVTTLFAVGATLSRVADASWTGACEHVRRSGPHVGRIGQWRSLCEGGWAAAVPADLPDIDKPGSGVIEKMRSGSPRKGIHYDASIAGTSIASTNVTGTTSTTSTTDSQSIPLMSPFPLTPIPGLGPNGIGGYFGHDVGDLKPPLPPFARNAGSPLSTPSTEATSPRLASPAPITTTSPPITQKKDTIQFPPPPQHPASPTRPHAGLPPASPTRSNVGLPSVEPDGLPPSTPIRPFATLPGAYETPSTPIRAPASPIRPPPSPTRPPASPARALPSPTRTPVPVARMAEVAPTPPTPSTKPNTAAEQATPTPARKPAENGGWSAGSWAPANNEQEDLPEGEPPVSISRFLNENKEMGIDLPALEGAAIRESVERMAAAAREASEGSGKPPADGANGWSGDGRFEMGPTGTVKKLVLDEEKRVISGGPRPMPERPFSTVEGERRPLPVPLDTARKRAGSIESLTSSGSQSRVAAMRSRYDNPGAAPLSPTLPRERPPLAHAVSDMMNAARAEAQPIRGGVWPPRQTQAAPPTSFQQRQGLISPSLDNIPSWSMQRERDWRAREYALNLEQRELELERARLALQREHQQFAQFTGESTSTGTSGASGTTGVTSKSGTTDTSGTTGTSGSTSLSGTTAFGGASSATIGVHAPFGRRPRSPESIPDDTRPPWATKAATTTRYTTTLKDDSDAESSSPNGKEKKGTWMGRGLRRLSMPAPFAERKQIQVVSIPAPNREGIGNRRSFDVRH